MDSSWMSERWIEGLAFLVLLLRLADCVGDPSEEAPCMCVCVCWRAVEMSMESSCGLLPFFLDTGTLCWCSGRAREESGGLPSSRAL